MDGLFAHAHMVATSAPDASETFGTTQAVCTVSHRFILTPSPVIVCRFPFCTIYPYGSDNPGANALRSEGGALDATLPYHTPPVSHSRNLLTTLSLPFPRRRGILTIDTLVPSDIQNMNKRLIYHFSEKFFTRSNKPLWMSYYVIMTHSESYRHGISHPSSV